MTDITVLFGLHQFCIVLTILASIIRLQKQRIFVCWLNFNKSNPDWFYGDFTLRSKSVVISLIIIYENSNEFWWKKWLARNRNLVFGIWKKSKIILEFLF